MGFTFPVVFRVRPTCLAAFLSVLIWVWLSWAKPSKGNGIGQDFCGSHWGPSRCPQAPPLKPGFRPQFLASVPPVQMRAPGPMPGLPVCCAPRLAAGAGALFIIQFSRLRRASPFAPPGGITNLEMQFHFAVLRY